MYGSGQRPQIIGRFPSRPLTGERILSRRLSSSTSATATKPMTGAWRMVSGGSLTDAFMTASVQWESSPEMSTGSRAGGLSSKSASGLPLATEGRGVD